MSLALPAAEPIPAPVSVPDIAAAVAAARDRGRAPAVDLRGLRAVHVDPVRRIAWVQPGAAWADLDAATQEHGLAVTGARVPSASVAATVLGDGSGWLERWMGLASDNLLAARVVTADGVVVHASESRHRDLLWALRGGEGRCGLPVELELALRPVGPEVLGGVMLWPRERAGAVAHAYRELMHTAPDALCGGLLLTTVRGRPSVAVVALYAGAPERGLRHLAGLRALAPAVDAVTLRPYRSVQAVLDGRPEGGPRAHLDELTDEKLAGVLAAAPASERTVVLLQPLGGAHGRVDELATANGGRSARWAVQVLADDAEDRLGARALIAALGGADAGAAAERRARLAEVQDRWDPERVFGGAAVRELRPVAR